MLRSPKKMGGMDDEESDYIEWLEEQETFAEIMAYASNKNAETVLVAGTQVVIP